MATAGRTVRVLLVDDNADVAEVTSSHLERLRDGFDVVVAQGAGAALTALDESIDCVVSDYEMPDADGLDLLREVREYDPTLPFVLFTGRGSEEIASEAISAGVTDYLQKEAGTDQYAVLANRVENAVVRRRLEATAEATESRYRSLVESSPHAILVYDRNEIRYVNDRLVELAGTEDAATIRGCDPLSLVHPADRDAVADRVDRVLDGGESVDWYQMRLQGPDGESRRVESRATPVQYEGERASQAVLRDVTHRYRRERRLEALHEATRRLLTARDFETVGEITVETVRAVFDEPVAAVWRYVPEARELAPVAATESTAEIADGAGLVPGDDRLPSRTIEVATVESGNPGVVENYGDRDTAVTDALETVYLYPLGEHGLLSIGRVESRSFDDSERDLVGILARSVLAALDRIDSEDA